MRIFEPCKEYTHDKFKGMQTEFQRRGYVFEYIIDPQEVFPFQRHGLTKALHCIEAIDKVARLNYLLKYLGLEAIDTAVFYKVLQTITENTPITDNLIEDYFMKVKELYEYSDAFWVLSDDLCFIPNSDLDTYVLGIDLNDKEFNLYAELINDFREGEVPFENFVNSARSITATDTATPHPAGE